MKVLLQTSSIQVAFTGRENLSPALSAEKREVFQKIFASLMLQKGLKGNEGYSASYFPAEKKVIFLSKKGESLEAYLSFKQIREVEYFESKKERYLNKIKKQVVKISEDTANKTELLFSKRNKVTLRGRISQGITTFSIMSTWARFVDAIVSWRKNASSSMNLAFSEALSSISSVVYLWSLIDSSNSYKSSRKEKDEEGASDAFRTGVRTSFSLTGYALGITSKALANKEVHSSWLTGFISSRIFDLASILGLIISVQRMIRSLRFLHNINQYWENSSLSEEERTLGILRFFYESTHLTEEEKKEGKSLEGKLKKFHRRIGNKSFEVLMKGDTFEKLLRLNDPDLELEEKKKLLEEAKIVIETVRKESEKKVISYVALFFASLLGLVASVISYVYGVCLALHILKMFTAFIWFIYMNYMAVLYFKYRPDDGYDLASQKMRYF